MGVSAQQYSVSGFVRDGASGEPLIGATVYEPNLHVGTTTNKSGFYSLILPAGDRVIQWSYVGYFQKSDTFYLGQNEMRSHELDENYYIDEIVVEADALETIPDETSTPNVVSIPINQIRFLPPVFGEVDLIKSIQMMPGVQTGLEGSGGFYVRGGTPDQNLILIDGVPVYNINHAFGYFSSFSTDAISQFQLYKGGFPARYGSRLSSVLDITLKDGNDKEFSGAAGLSFVAFYGYLEGPIIQGKTSFSISARRSMPGIPNIFNPFSNFADGSENVASFYDITAKITHRISERDKLTASFFRSKDTYSNTLTEKYTAGNSRIEEKTEDKVDWANTTGALRWSHVHSAKLFATYAFNYAEYLFNIRSTYNQVVQSDSGRAETNYALRYYSGIRDFSAKADYEYTSSSKHHIRYGGIYTLHALAPGAVEANFQGPRISLDTVLGPSRRIQSNEFGLYIEDDIKVSTRLRANLGLRISSYLVNGKAYFAPEPRASMRYSLNSKMAFKASYSYMNQYLHMLSNSGLGLPIDLWFPATEKIGPQSSHQVTAALVRTIKDNWEVSVEGYFKQLKNVIDYAEGSDFLSVQSSWENSVEQGIGQNYGLEFLVQKKFGNARGWLGYTLAWNRRKFDNINQGEWYYYRYDRRHQINLSASLPYSDRSALSFNIVYGSGYPITFPYGRYLDANGNVVFDYQQKNGYRLRYYLRFDVGYTNTKENFNSGLKQEFMVSIYNLFNRSNPYYMYLDYDPNTGAPIAKEVSLIPFFPSITYRLSF